MREVRRSEGVEGAESADDPRGADRPYGAPVVTPEQPGVVRRPWSEIELPDDDPIGGPVRWVRDTMDRTLNPNAIDHRHTIEVDRPDLPSHPPMHYDRPMLHDGDWPVDPPLWSEDGPQREDVRQGQIGDCWALSSIGAIAGQRPDAVKELVDEDGDGYAVHLHHARREEGTRDWVPTGNRVELRVSREVPHLDEEPEEQGGASIGRPGVMWVGVLEKALAGVDGAWSRQRDRLEFDDARGYSRMVGGTEQDMAETLAQLSGERAGVISLDREVDAERAAEAMLAAQLDAGHPVLIGTRAEADGGPLGHGLLQSHAYEVIDVADGIVQLRNPWGFRHPEPMATADLIADSRGRIATTASDQAREHYHRG